MRKKWTMEQILRGQNNRARQAGTRHNLTMEQWLETLINISPIRAMLILHNPSSAA